MWQTSQREPTISRMWHPGDRVIGVRGQGYPKPPVKEQGTYMRMYVTLNNGYRNPAYVIRLDRTGKERVFQHLQKLTD